jgi:hypothetical protein
MTDETEVESEKEKVSNETEERPRMTGELVYSRRMGAGKPRSPYTPCLHPSYDLAG